MDKFTYNKTKWGERTTEPQQTKVSSMVKMAYWLQNQQHIIFRVFDEQFTHKKSLESLRFLSEEELAHGERSESQPICTVWFQHRVGNDTRTCIHTYNNPHTCQAHKLKGMWIFHKSYSITEQLYWNISTRTHTHTALACCIIDVSHCSPLSTVTP